MALQATLHVHVERRVRAPAERVFDAWLDSAMLIRWMLRPAVREGDLLRVNVETHVGGRFSFTVLRHGQEVVTYVGRYLHLNRPRRLVFTWGIAGLSEDQSRVTIDLLPVDAGCDLALTHELRPHLADLVGSMEAGWTAMLDALISELGHHGT